MILRPFSTLFTIKGFHRFYHCHGRVYGYNAAAWKSKRLQAKQGIEINHTARAQNSNLFRYAEAFRKHGHKCATINPVPIGTRPSVQDIPELNPERYELSGSLETQGILHGPIDAQSVGDITSYLERVYCGNITVDFSSVEDEAEYEWLCRRYETAVQYPNEMVTDHERRRIAEEMLKSQNFDNFLATKFSNVKRYGGEGAEAMMAFFVELFDNASKYGLKDIVLGMPHRGRLNLLTGMLHYPPVGMFRKMRGLPEFPGEQSGAGDVLSHLTSAVDLPDKDVHVTMLPNPSHLEAVNPVAVGKARARHMAKAKGDYAHTQKDDELIGDEVLCTLIHGDAAFSGQGINQETLAMAYLPHYNIGGSIHLVVNNQVGFTTPSERGRSSRYSSDLARLVNAPVFHVSGDAPESVLLATRLALEFQRRFRKEVFVELHCFRKWGHNELDDPTFTNPLLYGQIQSRTHSVPDMYADELAAKNVLSGDDRSKIISAHNDMLSQHYQQVDTYEPKRQNLQLAWSTMKQPGQSITQWDTGLGADVLRYVGARSVAYPEDFALHSHLKKHHIENRLKKLQTGTTIDWGTAEALAIGSLLFQGFNVRISGQDVGRATFSHRHAMLVDQEMNEMYIPLNDLSGTQGKTDDNYGRLEMANSPLSEEAVLAFEYGLSVDNPNNLVIWEAQFGDFFNGAQIILDTYIGNGESKWGLQSALTMLLPHGLDGAGPEHSSCRMERFLQMSDSKEDAVDGDDVNWHIVNPTTSAQYFHLLRRQMIRNFRKPLVVVAPKILLRMGAASSSLAEMGPGTEFHPVLPDPVANPKTVQKIVFVCGKHYYALANYAKEHNVTNTAFIRVEQLCPFPTQNIQDEVSRYPNAKRFIWSQEEHMNSGAWSFVKPRLANLVGIHKLAYVGRPTLCQPAVGVGRVHQEQALHVVEQTFKL